MISPRLTKMRSKPSAVCEKAGVSVMGESSNFICIDCNTAHYRGVQIDSSAWPKNVAVKLFSQMPNSCAFPSETVTSNPAQQVSKELQYPSR